MPALFMAAVVVAMMISGPAWGQQACADRGQLLSILGRDFGEQPALRAIDAAGRVIEILVGPSGSWSMLVTHPGGPTCLAGSGEAFELAPRPVTTPGGLLRDLS